MAPLSNATYGRPAIEVPEFEDGAVAELTHDADGNVVADIRIPGPDHETPQPA